MEGHRFERLNGTCNIVLIEKRSNLRKYFNGFVPSRVMGFLDSKGFTFSCRWRLFSSATLDDALKWRLKRYLTEHWEPPSEHDQSGGTDPESAKWIKTKDMGKLAVRPCLESTLGEGCFTDWSEWYTCRDIHKLAVGFVIPPIPGKPNGSWSNWEHLGCPRGIDQKSLVNSNPINALIPAVPGIYEIRLNREFGRIWGKTDIVNIGVATVSLRDRVFDQKALDWQGNWSGSMKWIKENDPNFTFETRWLSMKGCSDVQIPAAENRRIAEFNLKHYEQPPGQTRPPSGWSKK